MKTIPLEFEDYPGDVYEVTVSPISLAAFEKVWEMHLTALAAFQLSGDLKPFRAEVAEFVKVAKPTIKGKAAKVMDLDMNLVFALVRGWHKGVRDVPLPLPRGSASTGTSPAE